MVEKFIYTNRSNKDDWANKSINMEIFNVSNSDNYLISNTIGKYTIKYLFMMMMGTIPFTTRVAFDIMMESRRELSGKLESDQHDLDTYFSYIAGKTMTIIDKELLSTHHININELE